MEDVLVIAALCLLSGELALRRRVNNYKDRHPLDGCNVAMLSETVRT